MSKSFKALGLAVSALGLTYLQAAAQIALRLGERSFSGEEPAEAGPCERDRRGVDVGIAARE